MVYPVFFPLTLVLEWLWLNILLNFSQSEKLQLKKEQLIAKVQQDENDRSSTEVQGLLLPFSLKHSGISESIWEDYFNGMLLQPIS